MALKKDNYPMVGFRYEVSIVPDMGADSSDIKNKGKDLKSKLKSNYKKVIASTAISAVDKASFSEISGVSVSLETAPVGDDKKTEVPRNISYSPLVLKRGLTGGQSQLMAWVVETMISEHIKEKQYVTKTVIVNLLSDQGTPLASWIFNGAYPTKWSMSGLKAMSNELIIEELELRYKSFYPVFYGI